MENTLISGASGFLGKIILSKLEATKVVSIGRHNANIICNIAKQIPKVPASTLVIHAAGKAHSVPKTPEEKHFIFDINVTGTQNILKGLEQAPFLPKSLVFISSVAVYGTNEGNLLTEVSPLNAKDPYGLSKIQAEALVEGWCAKHNVICTVLRLPLLAGPNPPGNLGAMINGIKKGYYFEIAGGRAKKSMVLAEDVASIIPKVAEIGGVYNLTDGYHPSFMELSNHIAKQLHKRPPLNMPLWLAKALAKTGDLLGDRFPLNSHKLSKITSDLTFDDSKAREAFGWKPRPVLEAFNL